MLQQKQSLCEVPSQISITTFLLLDGFTLEECFLIKNTSSNSYHFLTFNSTTLQIEVLINRGFV